MSILSFIPRQRMHLLVLVGMLMIGMVQGMVCVSISHAIGPTSFSIEPSFLGAYASAPRGYFTYNSVPGAQINDSVHVTNAGLVKGTVALYVVDAITGQMTGTTVRPRNEPQVDVGTWITLHQQQVTLDPGKSQEVPFTLTIPLHVRPGQHGGIIVAEDMQQEHFTQSIQADNKSSTNIGIRSFLNLGVLINLPGPTSERLEATGISYDEGSAQQRVLIALRNTGTQLIHPSGNLLVADDKGKVLQNIPIKMDTFIPQTSIAYPVYMQHKALALGRNYAATLHLTYEHQHVLNYAVIFYIPLPKNEPIANLIQNLVAPPSGNVFSSLTPWHYIVGGSILVLLLGTIFFWSQKAYKTVRRRFHK